MCKTVVTEDLETEARVGHFSKCLSPGWSHISFRDGGVEECAFGGRGYFVQCIQNKTMHAPGSV